MSIRVIDTFSHSQTVLSNRVWCVHWKHDGRLLATAGEDKTVKVWLFDLDTKKLTLHSKIVGDQIRTIRCVAFAPIGSHLATASFDGTALVYEWEDNCFSERHRLEGHENEVKSIAWSSSAQYLATSSRDKAVFIWQFDEEEDVEVDAIMQQHSGDVKFVAWHPKDEFLVSGGYDCGLIFYRYDGDEWQVHQHIKTAHEDTIWAAKFNAQGDYLVSAGGDSQLKLWKREAGATLADTRWMCVAAERVAGCKWPLYTLAWDAYEDYFAFGGGDRVLWCYKLDRATDTLLPMLTHPTSADINCLAFNPKCAGVLAVAFDEGEFSLAAVEE